MFIKYSSLTNLKPALINKIVQEGLASPDKMYICSEKIHGTNLSVIQDGDGPLVWASRTQILEDGMDFYQIENLKKKIAGNVQRLIDNVKHHYGPSSGPCVVQCYGEYAGTHANGGKIQKQVDYGEFDWYLFDIKVNGVYLSPSKMWFLAIICDINVPPVLKSGTLQECLDVRNDFQSVVREFKACEPFDIVEATDNMAEGTVIRSYKTVDYFRNGKLVVIKNKNDKFKEKGKQHTIQVEKHISENDKTVMSEATSYLVKARLSNVLSHLGNSFTAKDFGRINGLFAQDAIKDFEEDKDQKFYELFDDPCWAKKTLMYTSSNMVRQHWTDILENNF